MTKKIEIPREYTCTTTDVKFVCEEPECSFESKSATDVTQHEFEKHQMKAKRTVGDVEFFLLENKKDFNNLTKNGFYGRCYDRHYGEFEKAGWYGVEEYREDDYHYGGETLVARIMPISKFIDMWEDELSSTNKALKEAWELIEEK